MSNKKPLKTEVISGACFSTSTHVAIVADRTNSEQLFLQNVSKTSVNDPSSTQTCPYS